MQIETLRAAKAANHPDRELTAYRRIISSIFGKIRTNRLSSLVAVKAIVTQGKIEARIGAVEYARELFTAAKESPFSTKEMDDVADAELAKLP